MLFGFGYTLSSIHRHFHSTNYGKAYPIGRFVLRAGHLPSGANHPSRHAPEKRDYVAGRRAGALPSGQCVFNPPLSMLSRFLTEQGEAEANLGGHILTHQPGSLMLLTPGLPLQARYCASARLVTV